jgi:protein-tyrosine phosphatase
MPAWITEYIVTSAAAITAATWPDLASKLQVTAVVNLRAEYQDVFGAPVPLAYLWLPVADHTEPTSYQLLCGVRFLQTTVHAQQRTLIHCKMGIGRSTTLATAYLIWQGQPIDAAIQQVETAHAYHPTINRLALKKFVTFLQQNGLRD